MAATRMKPQDGGRGIEWRRNRAVLRLFSWRHGWAGRHFERSWWCVRWSASLGLRNTGNMLGLYVFRDEDRDLNIEAGLWLIGWHLVVSDTTGGLGHSFVQADDPDEPDCDRCGVIKDFHG